MTTQDKIEAFGPVIYRMLASEGGHPLSPDEIAKRSGISRSTVQRISGQSKWTGVRIETAFSFCRACGVELGDTAEIQRRLKPVQAGGIKALSHFKTSSRAPLWRRGSNGNMLKRIANVLTNQ